MEFRNRKGQVLIEAIFSTMLMLSLILIMGKLIQNHQADIQKFKASKSISQELKNEVSKN